MSVGRPEFYLLSSMEIAEDLIHVDPACLLLAFHQLISGYKGRENEGLGLRGGLVSKVLESRTKS